MDSVTSKKVVDEAYKKILKREPDELGFKHYLNLLTKDEITENELASLMKNSDEYKDIDLMNNFIKKYDLLFINNQTKNRLQQLSKKGDEGDLNANFFWHGKNFGFLNNIVIKSHLKVGYHPKIWLSGEKPTNEHWKDIESSVTVIDISEYFNAEEFLSFSDGMKSLDPDAFSLRWYKDMIYGTKNPWGLAAKNSFIIAIFATIGSSKGCGCRFPRVRKFYARN